MERINLKNYYELYHSKSKDKVLNEIKKKSTRLKEIYSLVEKNILPNIKKNEKILDIGCGFGYVTNFIQRKGYNTEGIDISETAIKNAKKLFPKCKFFVYDISKSSTKKKYNHIIMLDILEHIFDYKKAIYNVYNSLEHHGFIYIHIPCITWIKNRIKFLFGNIDFINQDYSHIRFFSPNSIKKNLQEAKFKDIKIKGYGKFKIPSLCGTILIIAKK